MVDIALGASRVESRFCFAYASTVFVNSSRFVNFWRLTIASAEMTMSGAARVMRRRATGSVRRPGTRQRANGASKTSAAAKRMMRGTLSRWPSRAGGELCSRIFVDELADRPQA